MKTSQDYAKAAISLCRASQDVAGHYAHLSKRKGKRLTMTQAELSHVVGDLLEVINRAQNMLYSLPR